MFLKAHPFGSPRAIISTSSSFELFFGVSNISNGEVVTICGSFSVGQRCCGGSSCSVPDVDLWIIGVCLECLGDEFFGGHCVLWILSFLVD